MTEKSLKNQAEDIMVAVERDLQQIDAAQSAAALAEVDSRANTLVKMLFNVVSDVDLKAASERVRQLKEKYPDASPQELAQILIREKSQKTATIGAVTSGAALIPGLGTVAALTLGVAADIGATFKLQAELVLEMAALYDYPLSEEEKQRLVMVITGISAGTTVLTRKAGQAIAIRAGEQLAGRAIGKSLLKAIPIVGVLASAGTNVLSTYIIGQRADAYFRLGPDAVGSWSDSLRAITGMDERRISKWLAGTGKATGSTLALGAGAGAVGAQKVGRTAKAGLKRYLAWLVAFWTAVFQLIAGIFGLLWAVVAFIPRRVGRFLIRHKSDDNRSNLRAS